MIDLPKPVNLAWGIRRERRSLWSRNAVKGVSVRGERRKRDGRNEWRLWDPNRSKVAASVLKTKRDASALLPESASTCLYLGASSGGTVISMTMSVVLKIITVDRWSQLIFPLG